MDWCTENKNLGIGYDVVEALALGAIVLVAFLGRRILNQSRETYV